MHSPPLWHRYSGDPEFGEVDADRLRRDWITAAAVERVLGTIVELAMDVNAHVVIASGRMPPQDYRSSFISRLFAVDQRGAATTSRLNWRLTRTARAVVDIRA